ncbi:TetR/AcrR family transcriptional regulator [Rhodococcus pyridinivorans]|uniref:TetR/AcrR family transcriptional regulator n=1 Tax=Rhodococcus pyridinivorans TaxID=103816 RepID=UPI000EB2BB2C|nr:TetR/AcrR family transcriptional regulator [Rhodococcus pyridinivorans]QXF83040.1 TetR/AcrR family transcriptional regulator [Rhodococcus pyridinivorans]
MTTTRGRYSSGEQTRIRLVEAAERLFARSGYDGVTLADIRKAAGQHNSSVVGYYFGSKEGLLEAVFSHRLPALNSQRESLLAEMLRTRETLSVRDLLWVIIRPLAGTLGRNNHYVAFLDRLSNHDRFAECFRVTGPTGTESGRRSDTALRTLLGPLPDDIAGQRLRLVYSGTVGALARCHRAGESPTTAELAALVDAWEALLLAPVSAETAHARGDVQEDFPPDR